MLTDFDPSPEMDASLRFERMTLSWDRIPLNALVYGIIAFARNRSGVIAFDLNYCTHILLSNGIKSHRRTRSLTNENKNKHVSRLLMGLGEVGGAAMPIYIHLE
jgi:hypothetical protein